MIAGLHVAKKVAFCSMLLIAQPVLASTLLGPWVAFSRTALATTGNIELSESRISFANGKHMDLSSQGVRSNISLASTLHAAYLFRVQNPKNIKLINNNSL